MILVGYSYNQPFMKLKLRLIFWDEDSDELNIKEFDRDIVSNWIVGADYSVGSGSISKRGGKDTDKMDKFKASSAYLEYRSSEYVKILMSELSGSL